MKLSLQIIVFFLISEMVFGQNTAFSPFKLQDYKSFQRRFLQYVNENPEKVIKIEDSYYSTEKIDSLLLIKNKFKKEKLSLEISDPKEIEKNYKNQPDNLVLPYAFFVLKENGFSINANANILSMSNKNTKINVGGINYENKVSRYNIYERITDIKNEIITTNVFLPNGILISTSSLNSSYGFSVGIDKKFDNNGVLKFSKDMDEGIEFGIRELLKIYKQEISKYINENKNSVGGYDYQIITMLLPKMNPKNYEKNTFIENFSKISKVLRGNVFYWEVNIYNNIFLFDTKNGKIIKYEKIKTIG